MSKWPHANARRLCFHRYGCTLFMKTDMKIVSEAHASGAHGAQADRTLTLGGSIFIGMGVPTHDD